MAADTRFICANVRITSGPRGKCIDEIHRGMAEAI
jgi:hypothetical protein